MRYRQLGKSGIKVSEIGLGANQFGGERVPESQVDRIVKYALEKGINFIDTANVYEDGQSEVALGKSLKGRWNEVVLASKFYLPTSQRVNDQGASRYHMMHAVEDSLLRLQSDHIDLYYVHRWDINTPIEETLCGLHDLIRMGKVRYIGASRYAAWQLAQANLLAEFRGWSPFIAMQSEYHLFEHQVETEILPYCQINRVGFVPYFPLAGGFLSGKYQSGQPIPKHTRGENSTYVQKFMNDYHYNKMEALQQWAKDHDRTLVELALSWLLASPTVSSVISGVTQLEQLHTNIAAVNKPLSSAEVEQINCLIRSELWSCS